MTIIERDALLLEEYEGIELVLNAMQLPGYVDTGSLHGAGLLGLIKATATYQPGRGKFRGYARLRIKGSILDELRRMDPAGRRGRRNSRVLGQAEDALTSQFQRSPTEVELASYLDITQRQLTHWRSHAPPTFVSFDRDITKIDETHGNSLHDLIAGEEKGDLVPDSLERADQAILLTRLVTELPERMRRIIAMVYGEGMKLWEVAEALLLTESRIHQLRKQAFAILRKGLALSCNQ